MWNRSQKKLQLEVYGTPEHDQYLDRARVELTAKEFEERDLSVYNFSQESRVSDFEGLYLCHGPEQDADTQSTHSRRMIEEVFTLGNQPENTKKPYKEEVNFCYNRRECCSKFTKVIPGGPSLKTKHNKESAEVIGIIKNYHPNKEKYEDYGPRLTKKFHTKEMLEDLHKQCQIKVVWIMYWKYLKSLGNPDPMTVNHNVYCMHRLKKYFNTYSDRIWKKM